MPAQAIASTWLHGLGVALQPRHTRIAPTRHPVAGVAGVDGLGCHLRHDPVGQANPGSTGHGTPRGCHTPITPAPAAHRRHLQPSTEDLRTRRAAPPAQRISRRTPRIWGWRHDDATVVAQAPVRRRESLDGRATTAMGTPSSSPTVRRVGACAIGAPPCGPLDRQHGAGEAPAAPCRPPHPPRYAGDGGPQPGRRRLDRLGHPHGQTPRHLSERGRPPHAATGPMPLGRTLRDPGGRPCRTRPPPPPLTRRRGEGDPSPAPPWTWPC